MGNAIFEGTLPKEIQERTRITGVELDWLTGQLARVLYPDADIKIDRFEKAGIAPGSMDVVTSNVPFGDIEVYDPTWKNDSSPIKRSSQKRIHNYFAVKMLETARPGGLVAMMTTTAVMDTPSNQHVRDYIASQGEILGAIRLPNNTFKGTGAIADIIYIRKWRDEADAQETRANEDYAKIERAFLSQTDNIKAPNKNTGAMQKVSHNAYYSLNPKNMIGNIVAGTQYSEDGFGLTSSYSVQEIADEISKAVKRIVGKRKGQIFNPTKTTREVKQAIREEYKGDGSWISNGNLVIQGGKVGVLTTTKNKYGEEERIFEEIPQLNKDIKRVEALGNVRMAMKKLIAGQIDGKPDAQLAMLRKGLQEAYDDFVKKYGKLQDSANAVILSDIDGYTLQALEVWKRGKYVGLSDIFTRNTIKPALKLDAAKTPQEAIATSLAEYGEVRGDYIAKVLGEDWIEKCGDIIFKVPNSEDSYVTRDEYLSGDVVTKLNDARSAAEHDSIFERNVRELEMVQPTQIPLDDIAVHLGARWIPQNILNDFVKEIFGLHATSRGYEWKDGRRVEVLKSGVIYVPESDTFEINIVDKELGGKANDWQTDDKSCKEILKAALEDKVIVIKRRDRDGKEWTDEAATELANNKVAELREKFEQWLPADDARAKEIADAYNARFNRIVLRKWDGSHLNVPGHMGMELRPHQKDAVWMLINNRGGIVDHIVGAGKTLVMQSAIMEMRRMGIAKKPMIVALKSTVAQIARGFKSAYPTARVLAPTDKDFAVENRKKFFANIALNDYDCVILSHEQYCKLPHTEEAERQVIDEQLAQLDALIEYLYGTGDTSQLTKKQIKALEKRREKLLARLEKRLDRNVDREFCFENLGVDYLFVDECHQFKSLPYVTSYNNIAGLGDAEGSDRAVALLTGVRYLQKMHQGDKGTVFLSGTTITNSLVEIYNLLNYLRPRKLDELGMPTFDAWASTFAVHTAEIEAGTTGEFKPKDRFRNFDNVPELSQLYAEIADVRNDSNLELPKPKVDSRTVIVPQSSAMAEINREIVNMLEHKDGNYFGYFPKNKQKAPWGLIASTLSAKASISPRLIFPDMDDEGGKIAAVCENVKAAYTEFKDQKGVQLIFCELGVPGKDKDGKTKKYDAYTDIINRLTKTYGIPRKEIAYIQEAKNDKEKEALFQRVRDGEVRILIGGTKNMGTGVNVQTLISDLHMLSVPWQPASLEQCIGRGARQGNTLARDFMGNKVRVYYYATEGSLDLYKFQLLDAKGKMFTQFKMGTISGSRSFDEGSADEDGNLDPAEMVAILSGNPVIFEKAKHDKYVQKLKNLYNGFPRDEQRKATQYRQTEEHLTKMERLVRLNDSDVRSLESHGFRPNEEGVYPFAVEVILDDSLYGAKRFDKPKEAGMYILDALKNGKKVTLRGFGREANVVMKIADNLLENPGYELQSGDDAAWSIRYKVNLSADPTAAGSSFRNLLQQIIRNHDFYHRDLEETKERLSTMSKGDDVFSKQKELDEALAKQREINAEYKRLAKTDDKKPAAGKNNGEDGIEYRTPEEGIEYVNARAIQPWSAPLDHLRFKRDELGYSLSLSERQQVRDLGAQEKAWEEKWAAEHTDTDVHTGRRSRFDYYAEEYGHGGMADELNHAQLEAGPLRDSEGRLISANAKDMARRAMPILMRRRADLLAERPSFSRAGQAAIDAELADLEYMALYYQRMEAGEDVERTMPGRMEHQRMLATAREVAESLGEKVVLYEAPSDIVDSDYNRQVRKQRSYGWYNPNDGTIHINVGRHRNAREIVKTVLHEIVGHKTIEQIMGPKRFARLIDEIWNHAGKKVRAKIAEKMHRNGWDFREATKEYLGEIAEEVHTKGYETLEAEKKTFWQRVKAKIQDFLNRILEGLKIPARIRLTENDLSYMMWKLYKHKERKAAGKPAEGDIFDKAEEIVRREQWERDGNSMEIAARDGGNNRTMADRAREVIEQPAIEIAPHDYSKDELKRVYSNLPSVEKDGRQIHFYHSAFKKIYKDGGLFGRIAPQLDQILEQAPFAYSRPDEYGGEIRPDGSIHKEHPNVVSFDNYVGKARIDGEDYFVRITVQDSKNEAGTHSFMATAVDIYEETANGLSLPITTRARGTADGVVDAKLREFFESAKKYPDYVNDLLPSDIENANMEYRVREKPAPHHTIKVYKLVRIKEDRPGEWFPLFIDSAAPLRLGEWLDADSPDLEMLRGREPGQYLVNPQTKEVLTREEVYQKHPELRSMSRGHDTKYPSVDAINYATDNGLRWMEIEETDKAQRRFDGENRRYWNLGINGSGSVSTFSMRPGWHAGSLPTMRQIGKGKNKDLRDDNFVWVEGEVSADVDYQAEAERNPDKDLPDRIPEDGFYMKATNANKTTSQADRVGWYVAGSFKANRFISDAEARQIIDDFNAAHPDMAPVAYDYDRESGRTYDPEAGLHFRDGDDMQNMTIEEQTLKLSVMLADRHSGDVAVRDAAVEALGKTLGNIRKAMAVQHTYDYNTVRSLGAVADILISSGTFLPEGPGEVKRLYGIMKRGIGHAYTDDAGVEHVTQSEKDYNAAVESLMDLFVSNQLKLSGKFLDEVMKIRGSKVNARGVEVMGELDVEGQIMVRGMKGYMSMDTQTIRDRIETLDDIISNGNDAAAMNAAAEKMGLELAEQYVAEVSDRGAQEKVMRDQLRDMSSQWDPSMSGVARKAYTEQKRALRESIRKIRIERADAMRQLASQIGNELRNSIERVKAFREREKQRIEEIWHNANSDMTGRAFDEHGMKKKGLGVKLSNNIVSRLLLAPAATFEQIMRVFGSKSVDGEGYLFDRYVRGWQECRDKEWTSTQEVEGILDKKAAEILVKRKARWSDLYALTNKAAGSCEWWDGGQISEHKVTQGNLMYLYMVNKMTDGQVKLRRMCITDDKMQEIERALDPKLKAVADWLQDELLPNLRNRYNEVHMRMFGAPMAEIENYFPLRILANARLEEVEMAGKIDGKDLPKTMTGAIIKRRFNNYALDVLNSDAVSVALDHIREMETWAAFAEYRRDLCTLLSYKHFRNQVKNMSTIHGSFI